MLLRSRGAIFGTAAVRCSHLFASAAAAWWLTSAVCIADDPPFFAALTDAMHGKGLQIDGPAGPALRSLNPHKLIFRGWSGSAHMVSWLIQAVATRQLTGIGIAAGLMFSGGSYGCFDEPPVARGSCAVCNTSSYERDANALGCSNTFAERGLSQPYCQLCCPRNFTEQFYQDNPEAYATHPPTFLVQTTVDFCSDSCAGRNYHECATTTSPFPLC